jgi:hypothetical protein
MVFNILLEQGTQEPHDKLNICPQFILNTLSCQFTKKNNTGAFNHLCDVERQVDYYHSVLHGTHACPPNQD